MNAKKIAKLRAETPGTRHVNHLNNAGAALMPQRVIGRVSEYLKSEAETGGYETFDRYETELELFYEHAARLIHAQPEEIAFMESATRAWQMAFYSLSLSFRKGDRILTSRAEYASNYIAYLQAEKRFGVSVEPVPNDESGQLSVDALAGRLDERVKLVSITHVPTNSGLINPTAEIGKLLNDHPAVYLLDACQSVGQMTVDVEKIGCDILSATGRKYLRGPRGTGFLFIRKNLLEKTEPVMLDLHSATWSRPGAYTMRPDAKRFENWEAGFAGKLGLSEAILYALETGPEEYWQRIQYLAELLRGKLQAAGGITVKDPGAQKCGIVSFECKHKPAGQIRDELRKKGINISVTDGHSTLLDSTDRGLGTLCRASVHYYNTKEEIEILTKELSGIVGR